MRVEKVAIDHGADAAGVQLIVGDQIMETADAAHFLHHFGLLKGEDRLLKQPRVMVHLDANIFELAQVALEHHSFQRRKALRDGGSKFIGQQVIDGEALDRAG
jgi:hypothetical protein